MTAEPEQSIESIHEILKKALQKSTKPRDVAAAIKLLPQLLEIKLQDENASDIAYDIDRCFSCPHFFKTEKGRKFLGSIFLLNIYRIKKFTEVLKQSIAKNSQYASMLGEITVSAWMSSNIIERSQIQTTLLKDIIELSILAANPVVSRNCRLFLEPFHYKRRRKDLSNTLVVLYQPVIFRYLHAANPVVRLNTILLFGTCFPLESSQFSTEKNSELLQQQISELRQCLSDEAPKVRASAAKSICRILYEWWEIFSAAPQTRIEFIQYLTEELCFDAASSAVRTSVIEGLVFLIGRFESIEFIMPHLMKMSYILHDSVEAVRVQFIKLLITINPLNNINIFEIVHIDHLIYLLKHDDESCALAVCQLLQPSLFPPSSAKGKENTCNTRRVARCIFLMQKSLEAAEKFYTLLPKFVSIDEILCFIKFAYFWADRTAQGKVIKLPEMKLKDGIDFLLPPFEKIDDLQTLGYEPHQAIWVIIASITGYLCRKSKTDFNKFKAEAFPKFNARTVKESLPSGLHPALFKFCSCFSPTEDEIDLALDYLQNDQNEGFSDALHCLLSWKILGNFFPKCVDIVESYGPDAEGEESLGNFSRAVRHLSFMFSHSELRKCIVDDLDNISRLAECLNKFITMLHLKLNLSFEGIDNINDRTKEIAENIPDLCYTQVLELNIALRVHLAIKVLQDDDEETFYDFLEKMNSTIFTPLVRGIFSMYDKDSLQGESLCFRILTTLLTLITDLLSLHVFDGDQFYIMLEMFTETIDSENGYGDEVKKLGYQCLSKIVLSVAVDGLQYDDQDHPAKSMLAKIVDNADSKEYIYVVKDLLEILVKTQISKRNMPWLAGALGDLFVADEIGKGKGEGEEEDTDNYVEPTDEDDEQTKNKKMLNTLISSAILKLSSK